ncbi:hypothetical protein Pelo_4920 [Pelomyxa schiedti]|nr:hypothetical protein Pelo_4920 [Pelomyxa schiedti]
MCREHSTLSMALAHTTPFSGVATHVFTWVTGIARSTHFGGGFAVLILEHHNNGHNHGYMQYNNEIHAQQALVLHYLSHHTSSPTHMQNQKIFKIVMGNIIFNEGYIPYPCTYSVCACGIATKLWIAEQKENFVSGPPYTRLSSSLEENGITLLKSEAVQDGQPEEFLAILMPKHEAQQQEHCEQSSIFSRTTMSKNTLDTAMCKSDQNPLQQLHIPGKANAQLSSNAAMWTLFNAAESSKHIIPSQQLEDYQWQLLALAPPCDIYSRPPFPVTITNLQVKIRSLTPEMIRFLRLSEFVYFMEVHKPPSLQSRVLITHNAVNQVHKLIPSFLNKLRDRDPTTLAYQIQIHIVLQGL